MYPYIRLTEEIRIPMYGLLFFIGFTLAVLWGRKTAPDIGLKKDDLLYASLYALLGIGAGAKLFYFFSKIPNVVRHFDVFMTLVREDFASALYYLFSGLVFYGGLFGALAGVWIYCRQYHVSKELMFSGFVPFIPLVHAFGRIGCFMAGCCYGIAYDGPLSVHFPYNELSPDLNFTARFPVQLAEAALDICLFVALYLWRKKYNPGMKKLCGLYFFTYALGRFLLEFLRGDAVRGHIGFLSTSQIISCLVLPVAGWMLWGRQGIAGRKGARGKEEAECMN